MGTKISTETCFRMVATAIIGTMFGTYIGWIIGLFDGVRTGLAVGLIAFLVIGLGFMGPVLLSLSVSLWRRVLRRKTA